MTIWLANPAGLNGQKCTSGRNAMKLVRRGRAAFLEDGTLFVSMVPPKVEPVDPEDEFDFTWKNRESGKSLGGNGYTVKQARRHKSTGRE